VPPEITSWHVGTNAELIGKCAALGYLHEGDDVLDMTFGLGNFWTLWMPTALTYDAAQDCRFPPRRWLDAFDVVTLDLPYRLRGTPDPTFDTRYGCQEKASEQDILTLLVDGVQAAITCVRPGGYLLVKCADQVCSGRVVWQTRIVEDALASPLVERFDMPPSRPQPPGRRQLHARRGSTLLIFKRRK